jgi:putative pyruvate formate lyase activating enzyme
VANPFASSLARCELCPRKCGADRRAGRRGYCRAGDRLEVYRFGRHNGEEPPISGQAGSGTVFFSRCTLRCLYCQNYPWSQEGQGREYDADGLAGMLRTLAAEGCHNWNLVSPTPWLPWAYEARELAGAAGVRLPVVYNTSGYERLETLRALDGWVDVYLTDLRYARPESAQAGSDAAGYVEVARDALREMWRQTGPLRTDAEGVASRGTICRLLVLPGMADEAIDNLRWLAGTIGPEAPVSVMAQYTPAYKATGLAPWNRRPTAAEYARVVETVERLGFTAGWVQEYETPSPESLVGFNMRPA